MDWLWMKFYLDFLWFFYFIAEDEEAFDGNSEDEASRDGSEDDDEGEEDEEESGDYEDLLKETTDDGFEHMKSTNFSSEKRKGVCVRNQINMWESILEMRIQFQKCLIAANKMPQSDYFKQLEAESGAEFSDKTKETKGKMTDLLEKFLVLQSLLISQYPETKNLLSKKTESKIDEKDADGDEEIPSEDEIPSENEETPSENEEIPSENEEETRKTKKSTGHLHKAKRRKLEYYEDNLKNFHEKYKPYCNNVVHKWNDKTRIVLSKTNEGSVLNQIQYALSDKNKLIKRTQLKRSNYQILGEEPNNDEYNSEIYDDDDFYHQLLRELIEFRSANVTDPVLLSRQWIQLQSLRSKMKRNVDTRATKGRKIRYAVHSKLVNFMAPIDDNAWTEEAKADLFKSLFRGQNSAK